jgi:hypothetical protein
MMNNNESGSSMQYEIETRKAGHEGNGDSEFRPIDICGEALSTAVLRERR